MNPPLNPPLAVLAINVPRHSAVPASELGTRAFRRAGRAFHLGDNTLHLGTKRALHGEAIRLCYRENDVAFGGLTIMRNAALLMLVLFIASSPALAKRYHGHRHVVRALHHQADRSVERDSHAGITCDMVRAYVAQVGLAQAVATAQSAGMTSSEKERARRCLAEKS